MIPRHFYLSLIILLTITVNGQRYVTLYADCDYKGRSQTYSPGRYYLSKSSFGQQNLSSLRVPSGMKVVLYTGNEPGTGDKISVTNDQSCLSRIGWNDKAVTIVVDYSNQSDYGGGQNNNYDRNRVTIFDDCNFGGRNFSMGPGNFDVEDLGVVGNDAISSIRIPNGYTVTVYENKNFGGQSRTYSNDVRCLNAPINDNISSLKITRRGGGWGDDDDWNDNGWNNNNSWNRGAVTIYSDCGYRGANKTLSPGYHRLSDLGIGNDALSSMRVPNGYSITVYEDDSYRGASKTYYNDVSCIDRDWNDRVSSIYIGRGNQAGGWNNGGGNNYNDRVELFEDCYYRGRSSSLGAGVYNLDRMGISNDALSSIRVPKGFSITIYSDDNRRGASTTYSYDVSCLGKGWNDNASSVWIRRVGF